MNESRQDAQLVAYCPICRMTDEPAISVYRREASRPKDPEAWNRYVVGDKQRILLCRFNHQTVLRH